MLLCLPVLLGHAAPAAAQTTRTLDVQVADAYEGEDIIVTLTLSSAFGSSLTEAARTITVSTDVPTTSEVNTCIATDVGSAGEQCTAGGTPASASDFTATNTSVVFGTSETVKTVSIPTTTDNLSEGLEVVELSIVNNGNGIANLTGRDAFTSGALIFTSSVIVNSFGQISDGSRPVPEISVSLPTSEGESRSDAGEKKILESEGSVGIGFNLAANQPLPSALTVCVRVTESGGDRVASGNEGIQTVNMLASGLTNGSGTHTLTWTNTPPTTATAA